MVIGIDASRANRKHKSGVEWYSYYIIRWLAKLDGENQYILYTDEPLRGGMVDLGCKQYCGEDVAIEFDKKGYQILKSPYNNFKAKVLHWPFRYLWTQGRMSLEMFLHAPDLLFVPAHTLPIIHPKKSVVTIHDIGFEHEGQLYLKENMGPSGSRARRFLNVVVSIVTRGKYQANTMDYLRWSTEYGMKKAWKVLTVSNFTKEDLGNFYKNSDKVKVIYNGYNKSLFDVKIGSEKINEVLDKYGLEKPYLLYVGRIEKKKNIPALIEAFAILKSRQKDFKYKLVLAGDASFGYDEVKYLVNEFDLQNDVIMPGWLEEEDMPAVYQGAAAFVFPSKYEGFGIPLLQAMASGVPIIASRAASIPEVACNAAVYFNPESRLEMAQAMEKALFNDEFRNKLIQAGYKRVEDFSWRKCAEGVLKELV